MTELLNNKSLLQPTRPGFDASTIVDLHRSKRYTERMVTPEATIRTYKTQDKTGLPQKLHSASQTYLRGYMFKPVFIPGQYVKNAAKAVSKTSAKFNTQLSIPWSIIEFLRVLQVIKSIHCITTIPTKYAVWQVYSSFFRSKYVYKE